jgi:hypothetical protein
LTRLHKGEPNMDGTEKKKAPPTQTDDRSKKKPPPRRDDDYEDGDIATPKQDRYGTDDEPL